jgi:hypothetical protein
VKALRTLSSGALIALLALVACSSDGPQKPASSSGFREPFRTERSAARCDVSPDQSKRVRQQHCRRFRRRHHGENSICAGESRRWAAERRPQQRCVTSGALDPLDASARSIAAQAVDPAHRRSSFPARACKNQMPVTINARAPFLPRVGRLIYRRPLTSEELTRAVETAGAAVGPSGDFYAGLRYTLSAMLISPEFLFVREMAEPDPGRPGAWRLDGYSKASRLSFLLWDSGPDDELLTPPGGANCTDPRD